MPDDETVIGFVVTLYVVFGFVLWLLLATGVVQMEPARTWDCAHVKGWRRAE